MTHVCVDGRLYSASGIGTFLKIALASLLDSGKYHLTVLCHEKDKKELACYSAHQILFPPPIYSLQEQFLYPLYIPACDLFWSPHFNVPLLPIKAKKRLATFHDLFHLAHYKSLPFKQKLYAKTLYHAAWKHSDAVSVISQFTQQELFKYTACPTAKTHLLSLPFTFVPASETVKKEFLLCVGNVKPHKNLLRLVKAYKKIQPPEPLIIVGKSQGLITSDKALYSYIEGDPFLKRQCRFTGVVPDEELKNLYASAKLFLFPSLYEGYGFPPLEAMASGCPVLASSEASIPEICGEAVEYINPFSVDSIASGMHYLLSDSNRRETLIQKGYAHIEQFRYKKNNLGEIINACCSCT